MARYQARLTAPLLAVHYGEQRVEDTAAKYARLKMIHLPSYGIYVHNE